MQQVESRDWHPYSRQSTKRYSRTNMNTPDILSSIYGQLDFETWLVLRTTSHYHREVMVAATTQVYGRMRTVLRLNTHQWNRFLRELPRLQYPKQVWLVCREEHDYWPGTITESSDRLRLINLIFTYFPSWEHVNRITQLYPNLERINVVIRGCGSYIALTPTTIMSSIQRMFDLHTWISAYPQPASSTNPIQVYVPGVDTAPDCGR